MGIKQKKNDINFINADISTEKKRNEGRTDIEIKKDNDYHIIIECKVNSNKLFNQRTQYLTAFDIKAKQKVICFITQERDTNKQITNDVSIINTSWLEIIELFNTKNFINKDIVKSFLNFSTRNYKMKQLKEILIQDVNIEEIDRFENFNVYGRNQTFGTPLYFAPYFTRNTGKIEGISNLSKILGILTLRPLDIDNFKSDLEGFANNKEQVITWINGVKNGKDIPTETYTYYFLDNPLKFNRPLRKDGGIQKGRGKDWIAAQIPPNRCVSFIDFVKHIPELM
ncbi:PD-(D/E)XK nuclease family protein [Flavobacterium gelidilacus]|uniref:PD-(D/E)XK nuclease family protein n=1 Tax=Flavobacterium gelidilacus TaxID=206041 RepID=UPI000A04BD89